MVKVLFILSFLVCSVLCQAQEFKKDGLLKASTTISSGLIFKPKKTNAFLHGHLEYFPEEKISLRGDAFIHMGSKSNSIIKHINTITFGSVYHLTKNSNFDPFIGIQPGLNIVETYFYEDDLHYNKVDPVITLTAGLNYYVGDYFNFFASTTYLNGNHTHPRYPVSLNEIRVSFGLGFNMHVK